MKEQAIYVSTRVKHVNDLLRSRAEPVLQSMVSAFTKGIAPGADLATLLKLRGLQKVDATALVQSVSPPREVTTRLGQRVVVDVAFCGR